MKQLGFEVTTERMNRVVHGLPITPKRLLAGLKGGSFCCSFADPRQAEEAIKLVGDDGILVLDNGAYSIWRAKTEGRILPPTEGCR